jgi:nucleoid-associated protein YgaU
MKRVLQATMMIAVIAAMAACSSSKKTSTDAPADEAAPTADAGTDAVPAASPEADAGAAQPAAAAAADPAPAAADAQAQAVPAQGSGEVSDYTVQEGDTLMKIAFETYGDLYQWKRIYEANKDKISNPGALSKGTVLKIEKPASPVAVEKNGEKYLIKLGDTLGKISDDVYGTTQKWKKIWENNKQMIKDPNKIFAGFYLYYTITPEEQQEADRLKQGRTSPAPLAGTQPSEAQPGPSPGGRAPASAPAPAPALAPAPGPVPPPPAGN